jgi:2,3-bisphosphoglycerate-independent phosphoglycerate mutase
MSATGVRDAVLARLRAPDREDLIVVNFANCDMVGHTGKLDAAVCACATVDDCVGSIVDAALDRGASLIVTADHGNCEQMWDPATNAPHTAHTLYDVPCIVITPDKRVRTLRGDAAPDAWFDDRVRATRGRLADVLPTVLALMGAPVPGEMTGNSLIA